MTSKRFSGAPEIFHLGLRTGGKREDQGKDAMDRGYFFHALSHFTQTGRFYFDAFFLQRLVQRASGEQDHHDHADP